MTQQSAACIIFSDMLSKIKSVLKRIPPFRRIISQRDRALTRVVIVESEKSSLVENQKTLQAELDKLTEIQGFVPPGHFYSPVPCLDDIRNDEDRIFGEAPRRLAGIEINDEAQLRLLREFVAYYGEMNFQADKQDGLRYYYKNPAYSYSDGILLHCMIRHFAPNRIIEIGSGHSSCMTLDTNDLHFDGSIETTFIEPYPELLLSLISESDRDRVRIIPKRLQEVKLEEFDALESGDFLFIDSTHVSKIDSDVNRILFDILPRLANGVYIHFHDIFYPFEYPKRWILAGRAWTENYILRAFLQFNDSFEVVLMNSYMDHFHEDFFREHLPLCLQNTGGHIWLRKL